MLGLFLLWGWSIARLFLVAFPQPSSQGPQRDEPRPTPGSCGAAAPSADRGGRRRHGRPAPMTAAQPPLDGARGRGLEMRAREAP